METVPLRIIAEKSGCSRATVSYALRGMACISAARRDEIQAIARKLGWKPDAELARQLALVRTSGRRDLPNLALVLNKPERELREQPSPRKHLEGAVQRARDLGYNLAVVNLAEKPLSPARLGTVLKARGIQGVVYLATTGHGATLGPEYMQGGDRFACAVVGIPYRDPAYHTAIGNLHACARLAIVELAKAGFKRPGAVLPRGLDRMLAWTFSGGIQAGNLEQPEASRVPICHAGRNENHLPDYAFPEIAAWIQRERPDVLVSTDLLNLRRFFEQHRELKPLRVCSLDHHAELANDFGVDQQYHAAGAAGVDLVVAQLHRGERGIPPIQHTLLIEGRWVAGRPAGKSAGAAVPAR